MEEKTIIKLAKDCGLEMCIYPMPVLTDMGDGTMRFIKPTEMTIYGKNLVNFVNLIEKTVKTKMEKA